MQSIRAILVRSSAPYQATVSALVSTVRRFLACISSAITIRTYRITARSEEHTSELQSLMRISYAVFCLKKKTANENFKLMPTYQNRININYTHNSSYIHQSPDLQSTDT